MILIQNFDICIYYTISLLPDRFKACSEPAPYREDTSALAGCGRAISQRVRSRGCEDLAILCSDRISPALANYTRQLAERDLAGPVDRSAGRSVRSS